MNRPGDIYSITTLFPYSLKASEIPKSVRVKSTALKKKSKKKKKKKIKKKKEKQDIYFNAGHKFKS